MKAKLLQEVVWFSQPGVRRCGIVFNIRKEHAFRGTRLVGDEEVEVYDIWTNQGQKTECCFLDIHYRRELMIEEFLTYSHEGLRELGQALLKQPILFEKLYDKREACTRLHALLTSILEA